MKIKKGFVLILVLMIISGCQPTDGQIRKAIEQTKVAEVSNIKEIPTLSEPTITQTKVATPTKTPRPTKAPTKTIIPTDINEDIQRSTENSFTLALNQLEYIDKVKSVKIGEGAFLVHVMCTSTKKVDIPERNFILTAQVAKVLGEFTKQNLSFLADTDDFVLIVIVQDKDERYKFISENDYQVITWLNDFEEGEFILHFDEWQEKTNALFE